LLNRGFFVAWKISIAVETYHGSGGSWEIMTTPGPDSIAIQ
jgi:hypothetical protein